MVFVGSNNKNEIYGINIHQNKIDKILCSDSIKTQDRGEFYKTVIDIMALPDILIFENFNNTHREKTET